jgi:hypothetical protein
VCVCVAAVARGLPQYSSQRSRHIFDLLFLAPSLIVRKMKATNASVSSLFARQAPLLDTIERRAREWIEQQSVSSASPASTAATAASEAHLLVSTDEDLYEDGNDGASTSLAKMRDANREQTQNARLAQCRMLMHRVSWVRQMVVNRVVHAV